jgi:parallel beta-helix repeat protein
MMNRKSLLTMILVIVLIGMLGLSFKVQRVDASGTIYIRADGSVEGTTNIVSDDNVTYVFTADINDSVVVQRSNIVIDGNGYTLQGSGSGDGFCLSDINNVTVTRTNIKGFSPLWYGIIVSRSFNISICGNNIMNNSHYGIGLFASHNNIYDNNITDNDRGIGLYSSHNNFVVGNNFANNVYGIRLGDSSDNIFYHNNFINNEVQVYDEGSSKSINVWDNGYPSGGNFWSVYTGVDMKSGFYQNETGSDGIGDMPHIINANNTDNYPLMGLFSDLKATSEYHVTTICNSTISDFQFNGTAIIFNVTGVDGTTGFCRICIPTALMNETYRVFVDGTEVQHTLLPCSNSTHSYLYFNYTHSTQEVIIIPEFPSFLILPLFMIATLLAVIVYKRKHVV